VVSIMTPQPRKRALSFPLDKRLGGVQSWSEHSEEEKSLGVHCISNPDSTCSLVIMLTQLIWLTVHSKPRGFKLNKLAEAIIFVTCICKVIRSNVGQDTGHSD
jgi:hypothetical protein